MRTQSTLYMCFSRAGQHRHHDLLQRVLSSQKHPSSSERQLALCVPDIALERQSASESAPEQRAEELLARAVVNISTPPALTAVVGVPPTIKGGGAAQHASACLESHDVQCNDLQPREPIALQPFQRQLDASPTHSHASRAGPLFKTAPDMLQPDPQMEAILCEAQAQLSGVTQAACCKQDWQDLIDSPADTYSSDQWQTPVSQPTLSQEACLDEETQASGTRARRAASLPKAQQDPQQGREATELRLHKACPAKHSRPDMAACEAAGAAQTETAEGASDRSEDMQGPSTPAGRPGRDKAKQDIGEQKQRRGMASVLQQDVASLKGQVSPPAHHQDDPIQ